MIRIMFVCHGNICRSPMAEFVFRDMIETRGFGDLFLIASAATSREELGNLVHYGTKAKLKEHGISSEGKQAVQLRREDYMKYDFLIGMEQINNTNIYKITGQDMEKKVWRLLDFSENPRDIDDPWYTGDFDQTYQDIYEGCEALLNFMLKQQEKI